MLPGPDLADDVSAYSEDGPSPAIVSAMVRPVAVVWLGVTLLTLILAALGEPSPLIYPAIIVVALAAVTVAFLLAPTFRIVHQRWIVPVAVPTALLSILLTVPLGENGAVFPFASQWVLLAVYSAALLLTPRWGWRIVVGTSVGAFALYVVVLNADSLLSGATLQSASLISIDVLFIGCGNAAAVAFFWLAVRRENDARQLDTVTRMHATETDARTAALQSWAVTVHDSLVNTFAAIAMGAGRVNPDAARQRAKADLVQLAKFDEEFSRITSGDFLNHVSQFATAQGVRFGLTVTVSCEGTVPVCDIPGSVGRAVDDVLTEALLNVSKHANVAAVGVTAIHTPNGFTLSIVDSGVGGATIRKGSQVALTHRATRAGIVATVTSPAGEGTRIDLKWGTPTSVLAATSPSRESGLFQTEPAVIVPIARRVGYWQGAGFAFQSVVLMWGHWFSATMAAAVIGGATIFAIVGVRKTRWPLPGFMVAIICMVIPVVVYLPTVDVSGCSVGPTFLGSNWAEIIPAVGVLMSNRIWKSVTMIATYVVVNGYVVMVSYTSACGIGAITHWVSDTAILLAVFVFTRKLRSLSETADAIHENALAVRATEIETLERQRIQQTYTHAVLASSRTLMNRFANDSTIDFDDPETEAAAQREERFLRAILQVNPEWGVSADAILRCVVAARTFGVSVNVRAVSLLGVPGDIAIAEMERRCTIASQLLKPGTQATLLVGEEGKYQVALIAPADAAPSHIDSIDDVDGVRSWTEWVDGYVRLVSSWTPVSPSRSARSAHAERLPSTSITAN